MQGDFSRDSFDLHRVFSRVLNQQGRVLLDADWNELQSIQLHLLRTLAADLIGPHGGIGFSIGSVTAKGDFAIQKGHYYVDGWLCQNDEDVAFAGIDGAGEVPAQPFWSAGQEDALEKGRHLVYLDVWERHLSWAEADGPIEMQRRFPPALRDVALGDADTASRAQVVWQVKASRILANGESKALPDDSWKEADWRKWIGDTWDDWKAQWQPESRGLLTAETTDPSGAESQMPCAVPPRARYRGVENQLYRVEIHQGGLAGEARFKWSRENGSVVFPVQSIKGSSIALSAWWRDRRLGLSEGDWIEVLDDIATLHQISHPLRRVKEIDHEAMTVYLDAAPAVQADDASRHTILRRWDHRGEKAKGPGSLVMENGILLEEKRPYALEDGIRVSFSEGKQQNRYRTGDYWLIPARTAIADVVWPRMASGAAQARPPMGVEHHYAPLAVVDISAATATSLRREIGQAAK